MATTILGLPTLEAAQNQKYLTSNQALSYIDALINLTVFNRTTTVPPVSPSDGDRYIVGPAATGVWSGEDGKIAAFIGSNWIFFTPAEGWRAYDQDANERLLWDGAAWTTAVSGSSFLAVNGTAGAPSHSFASDPDTGMYRNAANELGFSTNGSERFKLTNSQLISSTGDFLLNNGGTNSQATLNKNAVGNNAILNFQTGFTHHASLGLQGNNDFTLKVGTGFDIAMVVANDLSKTDLFTPQLNIADANGGALRLGVIEEELTALSGATATTTAAFPNQSIILGVSLRVTTTITGAASFDVGDGTTVSRFGGSIGTAAGSTNQGTIGPSGNYATTNVVLTANGGNFTAGAVRVCLLYLELIAPTS